MRNIQDILQFRDDISPFLVHLTKDANGRNASQVLRAIVEARSITPGATNVSDIRYGGNTLQMDEQDLRDFFRACCFTETPLDEVHCLLDIGSREVNLKPYGLVFLKSRLVGRGVSPVLYLNNSAADQDDVAALLFGLKTINDRAARKVLPLFAVFGQKIQAPNAAERPGGQVDFRWEREWRRPAYMGDLGFDQHDVFVGLCPHEEIDTFEQLWPEVRFVDPRRPMKWYATKLIQARERLGITHSVV